jgi:hypothetical protein
MSTFSEVEEIRQKHLSSLKNAEVATHTGG